VRWWGAERPEREILQSALGVRAQGGGKEKLTEFVGRGSKECRKRFVYLIDRRKLNVSQFLSMNVGRHPSDELDEPRNKQLCALAEDGVASR